MTLDENLSLEEFEKRLDASNARMRQEIEQMQARHRELDTLIARKEAFVLRLRTTVEEMERERAEIRATEKRLRVPRRRTKTPV